MRADTTRSLISAVLLLTAFWFPTAGTAAENAEKPIDASQAEGSGIWLWSGPNIPTIHVVNMTQHKLDWNSGVRADPSGQSCPWYDSFGRFCPGVDAYRTVSWGAKPPMIASNQSWDGDTTFSIEGQASRYNFKMHFAWQNDDQGYFGMGSWVSLLPVNWSTWKGYNGDAAAPDFRTGWQGKYYVTRVNDLQMHNIMTMVSDRFLVALFSPDNCAVILVVQENLAGPQGSASDFELYKTWPLNWTDNDEYSVPGPKEYPAP